MGWAAGFGLVLIGMVLGGPDGLMSACWHLGVLLSPGLVELHLQGTSGNPFPIPINKL